MLKARVDHLKQAHGFEAWRGRTGSQQSVFVGGFRFTGRELPDLRIDRVVNVGALPASEASRARGRSLMHSSWQRTSPDGAPDRRVEERLELLPEPAPRTRTTEAPSITRSLWRGKEADTTSGELSIVVVEHDSRDEAQEGLIELLAGFESTRFAARDDLELGDVCFALPSETVAVFSRGNLAVLVRNATSPVQAVTEAAKSFDGQVEADPEPAPPEAGVAVRALAAEGETLKVGEETPLRLEATVSGPLEPVSKLESIPTGMFKFFTVSGEVLRRDGRLVYRPERAGRQEVTAYLLDPEGRGARRRIRPVAEEP